MNKLTEELIKPILEADSKIKKVVGIYGGRFQPFGPHHLKTFKWLEKQVDDAYIATSDLKKPPRHPMNFKEKVRHMTKMGVSSSKIVFEKSPYNALNLAKKYDSDTTVFVYVFGAKDAGRLGGSGKYFQDYKKNKKNLKGFEENGYYLVAPHVSVSVGGKEVSGTSMRNLLGSSEIDDSERAKLFKDMFGYFNKGIFQMMVNKFKKLFEVNENWLEKGSKKDKALKLKISKLYSKAFKVMPNSPAQLKIRKEIEKLRNQLSEVNEANVTKSLAKAAIGWKSRPEIYFIVDKNGNEVVGSGAKQARTAYNNMHNILKDQPSKYKKGDLAIINKKTMKIENPASVWGSQGFQGFKNKSLAKKIGIKETDDVMIFKPTKTKKIDKPEWHDGKDQELLRDFELDLDVGDTILMGKFKNKKVLVKTIGYNEKGDLKINGKSAMRFRPFKKAPDIPDSPFDEKITKEVIENFLVDVDVNNLIDEVASSGGPGMVDDGPSGFMGGKNGYTGRNKLSAEQLGFKVVDYIFDVDIENIPPIKDDLRSDRIDSVTFFPAGDAEVSTPNNQQDLAGGGAMNKWKKHIQKLATTVGMKLLKYMDKDDENVAKKGATNTKKQQKKEKDSVYKSESTFSTDWWKKNLITEGGAYGHMAHPFDDKDLTFGDLKKIIELGLGGNLSREEGVTEKMDGQNLMVSWKNGKLLIARNKGHIKNFGKTALDVNGIKSKFEGRGNIADAFGFAVTDMQKAIKGLSQKQKDKIFNEGRHWMNLEVMWPASANVIDYDVTQIIFHGALKYDDSGNVIGEVSGSGRILAGMLKQINQHIQKNYTLGSPHFLKVPKHQDFGKMKKKYLSKLTKLKNEFGLKDSDTLSLYHQKWWETFIRKQQKGVSANILKGLTKRWAFFDKSYKIPTIKKDITDEKFLDWVLKFDKQNHAKQVKTNMRPFEVLFFEVGAEIMKNMSGFIAASPDKAVQGIKDRIDKAVSDVKNSGDLKKLNTLKIQMDRLNAIGGFNSIVPSEGIVFKYKGNTYKFTGSFAPANQITGLMNF